MDDESDKIDALIASLEQSDKRAVRKSVDALISRANSAPDIAAKLRVALDRAPAEKRWPIAYVLAHVSPLSTPCLEALMNALDVSDPDIRWAVVLVLVRLGKNPESGVALRLIELVRSAKPTQRRMAVYCLRDIGADDPAQRQAVQRALGDPDPLVRVAAVTSLKAFPMIGGNATDQLLQLVSSDPDSRVQSSAAMALAHLGPPTEKVSRALNDAALSSDNRLAKAARAALALLKQKGPASSADEAKRAGPGD
jgi:HEAT repeat protein